MVYIRHGASLQGRVKFPTGGKSPPAPMALNRCNSGTDGTVRMKEGAIPAIFACVFCPETVTSRGFFCADGIPPQQGGISYMTVKSKTHRLTLMAMFAAMAYIIMAVGRFPISSVEFLKYDPKDVILVMASFILGPLPGLGITLVVAFLEMITVSSTGPIGFLMNFLSSAAFLWPAAAIYKRRHTLRGAMAGLAVGVLAMTAVMLMWNYFITPYYMGYPREAVAAMLAPVFLPFNLVKGGLNAAVTMLVYKPVSRALKKSGLVEFHASAPAQKKSAVGAALIALLVLVSCIFAVLIMRGIL